MFVKNQNKLKAKVDNFTDTGGTERQESLIGSPVEVWGGGGDN